MTEQVTRICKADGSESTLTLRAAAKTIAQHFDKSEEWATNWLKSGNGAQTNFAFYEMGKQKSLS